MHNALVAAYSSPLVPDAGTVLLLVLVSLVPTLLVYVWSALALSRVYTKLGIEGWKAWVPVYNVVVLFRLGNLSPWLLLLYLIPFFGAIFVYVAFVTAAHRVTLMFGHGAGMTVLAALLFPVWASVLGFGSARPVQGGVPRPVASDTDALQVFSGQFAPAADDFAARRDVPSPSAWIPPAPPAPGAAPVPVAGGWGEPPVMPAAPPAPVHPTTPAADAQAAPAPYAEPAEPYAAPAADPFAVPAASSYAPPVEPAPATAAFAAPAPVDDPYVAPLAAAAEPEAPAPVMSWWQPAIVDEEPAPAAPAWAQPEAADPAPISAPQPDPEPESESFVPVSAPPVLRDSFVAEPDAFPEASGEVSAVAGAPIAGMPRPAAASVAASRPGVGDLVEDTVIASRRRPKWALLLPGGVPMELTGDAVVLGRRPVPVHAAPGAQLVTVNDETRTVSKTHALLRRRAEVWMVSDLDSTNGVVVFADATEIDVAPGAEHEVGERFLLGDAELRLVRTDGS